MGSDSKNVTGIINTKSKRTIQYDQHLFSFWLSISEESMSSFSRKKEMSQMLDLEALVAHHGVVSFKSECVRLQCNRGVERSAIVEITQYRCQLRR